MAPRRLKLGHKKSDAPNESARRESTSTGAEPTRTSPPTEIPVGGPATVPTGREPADGESKSKKKKTKKEDEDKEPKVKEPKGKEPKGKEPKGKEPKGKEPKGKEPKGKVVPRTGPIPTTSNFKDPGIVKPIVEDPEDKLPCWRRFCLYLYNRDKGTFCGRTCLSWLYIVTYSIMYFIFLTTYMLIFLFASLSILKSTKDFKNLDKTQLLTYSEYGIGLTATPTTEGSYPLIWYRNGDEEDYKKYIKSIDNLLMRRKTRDTDTSLGQCGRSPYGYGSAPCVIVRINKQLKWTGKALSKNSTLVANAPKEVKDWVSSGRRMLWLHCEGYHSYDKEHIGDIGYYPNPPGFDPALYPLDVRNDPPLVAVQFSSFAHGVSLAVECKLWHEHGPSSVDFVIYVEPHDKTHVNASNILK